MGRSGSCTAGAPAGETGGTGVAAGAAGALGGFGMYSGPGWPQPASMAVPRRSAIVDFTIRITV
jgi:hypothetical protein